MLGEEHKAALLKLARTTLESYLTRNSAPSYKPSAEALTCRHAAFVSLHNGEELRGCIGQVFPDRELYKIVQHCVLSAALEDTRFLPVTAEEIPDLSIEISILAPFRRIERIEEIEIGKHGLYIVKGGFRGLLLPQVAVQYGWDRRQFLEHACRKSGLPESAWQDPETLIHIFEAEVFSDAPVSAR